MKPEAVKVTLFNAKDNGSEQSLQAGLMWTEMINSCLHYANAHKQNGANVSMRGEEILIDYR